MIKHNRVQFLPFISIRHCLFFSHFIFLNSSNFCRSFSPPCLPLSACHFLLLSVSQLLHTPLSLASLHFLYLCMPRKIVKISNCYPYYCCTITFDFAFLSTSHRYDIPLVADIHFAPAVALRVAEAFEKIR